MEPKDVFFPYETIRKEQDDMIKEVKHAVENKSHLIMHAPTGIGKTAAALAPSLKYAADRDIRIFFLTSRHTQHVMAIETLKEIKKKYDLDFTAVDIIGKKWMCIQPGTEFLKSGEFADYCKAVRAEGKCDFYTRCRDDSHKLSIEAKKLMDGLKSTNPCHVENFIESCREDKMCPYEISVAMSSAAKVIITDYHYIFNPDIRESFFAKTKNSLDKCIIIVDEAHNLPERTRDLMSSKISNFTLKKAVKEAKNYGYIEHIKYLAGIQDILNRYTPDVFSKYSEKPGSSGTERVIPKQLFESDINKIEDYKKMIEELEFIGEAVRSQKKRSYIAGIASFLQAWKGDDEGFVRIFSSRETKFGPMLTLNYRCMDPSLVTRNVIKESHSTIMMSGTLTPTEMYKDLLGFPENTVEKEFENPFAEENRLAMIIPQTTTKYNLRSEEQFMRMAKICAEITENVPGNCTIFFPSYDLRNKVYRYFFELSRKTAFLEEPGLSKQEKNDLLEKFKSYKNSGAVLLGAVSGNFAEGIDLPGDLLKCVIVVGLPLAQPDLETKELIKYYDVKFKKGWDYGYVLPAFIKCLQGAGRCIRSETDRGVIIFLDERYTWPMYTRCFPKDYGLKVTNYYKEMIGEFFG